MCNAVCLCFVFLCSKFALPVNYKYESSRDFNNFNVGIIGAGISGLYAALLLQDLGIENDVFEATERTGGRYYTHYFNEDFENPNYVEMGAQRLPNVSFYDRVIGQSRYSIVNYLNERLPINCQLSVPRRRCK
ncbi:hypothetical protein B4U80_13906 [Leptotrombidium deliense]|uniref:Amine oxidase domain-containing protein n=1 Tax=Leptotrombidium deliense TaxID=299467 RepID=A0A443S814_9ACAR|nr:hypothetical protein B4U80_13906 [Leptotrombidium deliense]